MAFHIVWSIIMMAIGVPDYFEGKVTVQSLNAFLNFIFLMECGLKVTARGWSQYLLTASDRLDFVV